MSYLFDRCESLETIKGLDNFNTSNVTNMEYMFYGCSTLKTININDLNTTLVENMEGMLQKCSSLTILDLSSLDTNLTKNANNMFSDDINLAYINLTNFDESSIIQTKNIFKNNSFEQPENTLSKFLILETSKFDILIQVSDSHPSNI